MIVWFWLMIVWFWLMIDWLWLMIDWLGAAVDWFWLMVITVMTVSMIDVVNIVMRRDIRIFTLIVDFTTLNSWLSFSISSIETIVI